MNKSLPRSLFFFFGLHMTSGLARTVEPVLDYEYMDCELEFQPTPFLKPCLRYAYVALSIGKVLRYAWLVPGTMSRSIHLRHDWCRKIFKQHWHLIAPKSTWKDLMLLTCDLCKILFYWNTSMCVKELDWTNIQPYSQTKPGYKWLICNYLNVQSVWFTVQCI